MNETTQEKNRHLGEILTKMGRVMVAFSGGVDSTLVLKRAQQELGDQVLAVVVGSELFRQEEFDAAVKLAEDMGVQVYQTEMKELENLAIVENTPNSWDAGTVVLYPQLKNLAEELGYPYVLEGLIMDDLEDFRPGMQARTEAGICSVLQEAGLFKHE